MAKPFQVSAGCKLREGTGLIGDFQCGNQDKSGLIGDFQAISGSMSVFHFWVSAVNGTVNMES
jgi:type 1 glutamine amidotransferase